MLTIKSNKFIDSNIYTLEYNSSTYDIIKNMAYSEKFINIDVEYIFEIPYDEKNIQELVNLSGKNNISNKTIDLIHYLDLDYLFWNYKVNLDETEINIIQELNNIIKNIKYYINEYHKYYSINELLKYFNNDFENIEHINEFCCIDGASRYQHINILRWFSCYYEKTNIICDYDDGIQNAGRNNDIDILKWFIDYSELTNCEFKYWDNYHSAIDFFALECNIDALEIFKNYCIKKNIEFKYKVWAICWAAREGHINVLNWFAENRHIFGFIYDNEKDFEHGYSGDWWEWRDDDDGQDGYITLVNFASVGGQEEVLNWFYDYCKKTGTKFKYSGDGFEYAVKYNHKNIIEWFRKKPEFNLVCYFYNILNGLCKQENVENCMYFLNVLLELSEQYDTDLFLHDNQIGLLCMNERFDILEWFNDYYEKHNKTLMITIWVLEKAVISGNVNMINWVVSYCNKYNVDIFQSHKYPESTNYIYGSLLSYTKTYNKIDSLKWLENNKQLFY